MRVPIGDDEPPRPRGRGDRHRARPARCSCSTEQLSAQGVPVFVADIKGDLGGLAMPGEASDRVTGRPADIGYDWTAGGVPVEFVSLTGALGVQLRATVSSFGPLLLAKALSLNETQTSVLTLVFKYADDSGLPLLDLSDLRAVLQFLGSDEGKAALEQLWRHVQGDGGRAAAEDGGAGGAGRGAVLRRAGVRRAGHAADHVRRPGRGDLPRAGGRPGQAGALLHLHDVAAGRAVSQPPRGGGSPQAEAGVLLRRGAPALRRRVRRRSSTRSSRWCG